MSGLQAGSCVALWQDGECRVPRIRVARGVWERGIGLMFRKRVPERCGTGYVFLNCRELHTFGMRFRLDMVWLDAEWNIVQVRRGVPPGRVARGPREARHVFEAAAGSLPELGDSPIRWEAVESLTPDGEKRKEAP